MSNNFNQQHKYLTISSADRVNGTPSKFLVNLPYGINFNYAELINCQIANTFYNITNNNNAYRANSIDYLVPPGCYNFDELINTIVAIGGITSITYNDITGIVTINTPTSLELNINNSIAQILGFTSNYSAETTVHNSSFPPSLFYSSLYIDVTEFNSNQFTSNNRYRTPTFTISNNANKNFVIFYSQYSQHEQRITSRDNTIVIHSLNIIVKDQFGTELQGLSDWSMVLKLNTYC